MDILKFFQNSLGLYFGNYKEGSTYLKEEVKWFEAFLFVFVLMIISNITSVLVNPFAYQGIFYQFGLSGISMILIGLIGVLFNLLFFVVFVFGGYGLLHLFFRMFGGKGDYGDTIKFGMGLVVLPLLVNFVISIVGGLFMSGGNFVMTGAGLILGIIGLGVLIWHVIISVLVYSIAHDISGGKTFGALALTFGVFLIIAVIVTIILATILFGMASTITTHPHMY